MHKKKFFTQLDSSTWSLFVIRTTDAIIAAYCYATGNVYYFQSRLHNMAHKKTQRKAEKIQ